MKRKYQRLYSVLIVKPYNKECMVDERVNQFIMKAFSRGIGEYLSFSTKLPELARNRAICEFLHNPIHKKKTHIFFLDADTEPMDDYAIERLLHHNKDVVAGVTPIVRMTDSSLNCMWSAMVDNKGQLANIGIGELPKKLFKAERAGGTTLLISRKVLEKLKPPYQKTVFNDKFTDVVKSEDIYFCDKVKEAGFDIYIDPTVVCHHYHRFDLLDIFSVWKQAKQKNETK